jgi:hypothetical protein
MTSSSHVGPSWLDEVIVGKGGVIDPTMPGLAKELSQKLDGRGQWLIARGLAERSSAGETIPKPDMVRQLRAVERRSLVEALSRELKATYFAHEDGRSLSGVYELAVATPTAKLAVIRREDTFTLVRWQPALEPMRGTAVVGIVRGNRIAWSPHRGRDLGRAI